VRGHPHTASPRAMDARAREDWSRIHNVDQRAPVVRVAHACIDARDATGVERGDDGCGRRTGVVEVAQRGSSSSAFVADTSTVIWPMSAALATAFCDATQGARDGGVDDLDARADAGRAETCAAARDLVVTARTRIVELGAGLGLLGIVLARIGARRVTITDANVTLLAENVAASGGERAECARLVWASPHDGKEWEDVCAFARAYEESNDGELPHLIVGTDVMYSQSRETCRALAHTMARLADEHTVVIIGFEDRGDWGQVAAFFEYAEDAGLYGDGEPFGEDEDDWLLIRLSKRRPDANAVATTAVARDDASRDVSEHA